MVGWLEDIFLQALPTEAAKPPKLSAQDNRTEATQYKVPANDEGQERDNISLTGQDMGTSGGHKRDCTPPTKQKSKNSGSHNGHDKKPDSTPVAGVLSTTSGNIACPRHNVMRTRSGQSTGHLGLGSMYKKL